MNFERFENNRNIEITPTVDIEDSFAAFIPEEFQQDPLQYFETQGINIKTGEKVIDETGRVREDPTAVKEFPTWVDCSGHELQVVGKRVNTQKGKIEELGNPFYEYDVMQIIQSIGLPCPQPIAKIEQNNNYLILTKKIKGIGWYEKQALELKSRGYTDQDIESLKTQAELMMIRLSQDFEEAGIYRGWKLKDMIFDIDIENKKIIGITPTDWERTSIDLEKLEQYKNTR